MIEEFRRFLINNTAFCVLIATVIAMLLTYIFRNRDKAKVTLIIGLLGAVGYFTLNHYLNEQANQTQEDLSKRIDSIKRRTTSANIIPMLYVEIGKITYGRKDEFKGFLLYFYIENKDTYVPIKDLSFSIGDQYGSYMKRYFTFYGDDPQPYPNYNDNDKKIKYYGKPIIKYIDTTISIKWVAAKRKALVYATAIPYDPPQDFFEFFKDYTEPKEPISIHYDYKSIIDWEGGKISYYFSVVLNENKKIEIVDKSTSINGQKISKSKYLSFEIIQDGNGESIRPVE